MYPENKKLRRQNDCKLLDKSTIENVSEFRSDHLIIDLSFDQKKKQKLF